MSWKSRATPVTENTEAQSETQGTGSWKDRATSVAPEISEGESGIRGAAQGLSFGFADEATGAYEAAAGKRYEDMSEMEKTMTRNPITAPLIALKGIVERGYSDFKDDKSFDDFLTGLKNDYKKSRDESRANYKKAEEANPKSYMAGQVVGAGAPALLTAGGSTAATIGSLAAQGAAQGLGSSEADLTEGDVGGAVRDTAIGGTIGAATGLASRALSAGASKAAPYAQKALNKVTGATDDIAERLAINATGATGREASHFAPGTGRKLLDDKLVRFGDTAGKIEGRISSAMDDAGAQIDDVLKKLDASGATASVDNVVNALEQRVAQLKSTPGNERIIKQLQGEIDNLYLRGDSNILPSAAEQAKRNFQGQTNYFSPEFEKKASTQVGRAFKEEVERVAEQASPELAEQFGKAKSTYGMLSPVQEAAEKRAAQQAQSPLGGFGDLAAGALGAGAGGPIGAAKGVALKRLIQPRIASSSAVIADNLAKVLKQSPQVFGKYAKTLQAAAARGGNSLAATHFVLQQTQPEYRALVNTSEGDLDEQE